MGKAEVGTPKWVGNRIKAKGLQKLRWYCQMCQKQCRDENGFKCHTMSESHQRQLLIFADTPHKFLDSFSKEFQDSFLKELKRAHGTKRVFANTVYKEYISDRHHVHMNSTKWVSLTGFVKHLGRAGHCVVDETEKGWYITWIDRDPETIARQEALKKKEKHAKDDEERLAEFIKTQVERDHKEDEDENSESQKFSELVRASEDEKIKLSTLKLVPKKEVPKLDDTGVFKKPKSLDVVKKRDSESSSSSKRKLSALEEIKVEEEERKRKASFNFKSSSDTKTLVEDHWLKKNIVVKIVTKTLGDKYYKEKGYVKDVLEKYTAVVVLLSSGAKLKLDQTHLETVVPALGKDVLILKGQNRGEMGVLEDLDIDNFCAHIKVVTGKDKGNKIKLPYENFSKVYSE